VLFATLFLSSHLAQAESSGNFKNLQVVFDGCEPLEVISHDESCATGSKDPKDTACRKAGPVRWSPVEKIQSITVKAGTPVDSLKACHAMTAQGYYQCIVSGNVGDRIAYNVTSSQGCVLDPVIIIN